MQSNLHVLESLLKWLEAGECAWLCTITKTWGSSPNPAGTLMAYSPSFGIAGSLSGGCIEEDLLERMREGALPGEENSENYPVELIYGGTEEDQKRFVLPCGGRLHLLVEYFRPEEKAITHFKEITETLSQRKLVGRKISVDNGSLEVISEVEKRNVKRYSNDFSKDTIIEHFMGPAYQMLLIGASEVARCVAELAQPLDFKVSVWDHRKEFIRNWQVENVKVLTGSPEKIINQHFFDQNNAIIALAHDPRVDDFALVDALASNAFYVGAIGSTNTCNNRNKRLQDYLDDEISLKKLHSPVGLSIGSKTPYEIAISILAEVIMQRSKLEKTQ